MHVHSVCSHHIARNAEAGRRINIYIYIYIELFLEYDCLEPIYAFMHFGTHINLSVNVIVF